MWSEVGRAIVLGSAPQEMADDYAFALAAQAFTMQLMRPGAAARDVWEEYSTYLREDKPARSASTAMARATTWSSVR